MSIFELQPAALALDIESKVTVPEIKVVEILKIKFYFYYGKIIS